MPDAFKSIVHPTDLDQAGKDAFAHGLKLALASKGRFAIVHSAQDEEETDLRAEGFPGVRDTLASWGLLDLSTPAESLETALGIRVSKSDLGGGEVVDALVDYVERHACDLLVLATHARDGLPRWLKGSVAETLAQRTRVPALFLPHGARGFVEPATGQATLTNVLLPVDDAPSPVEALALAAQLLELLGSENSRLHTLHVGALDARPALGLPAWLEPRTEHVTLLGPVAETIVTTADQLDADLIVMATEGRHGFLDALRGSTTETVLRRAHRPLLAVPA